MATRLWCAAIIRGVTVYHVPETYIISRPSDVYQTFITSERRISRLVYHTKEYTLVYEEKSHLEELLDDGHAVVVRRDHQRRTDQETYTTKYTLVYGDIATLEIYELGSKKFTTHNSFLVVILKQARSNLD